MKHKSSKAAASHKRRRGGSMAAWEPFRSFREHVGHLFDDFAVGEWPRRQFDYSSAFADFPPAFADNGPAVDVIDNDKRIEIRAELPGMDDQDIDVRLTDDMITIRGEKKDEREQHGDDDDYSVSERHYGSFQRSFRLPAGIDAKSVTARFKKGVLTVKLPKTAEARDKSRRIDVVTDH